MNNINVFNESKIVNDSVWKISVLFGIILNVIKIVIFSVECMFIVLNGELSGNIYKGEVIEWFNIIMGFFVIFKYLI